MGRIRQMVLVGLVLAATACASAGTAGGRERNRITAEQIAETQARNAWDVIQRLQPVWLSSRGPTSVTDPTPPTATVYVDGSRAGGIDFLRTVPIDNIAEIRYFPAGEAATRFGLGHPRGVIEVISTGRRL